ncbi:hypothetical protein D2V17_08135 [Aurantiacibacter xanthus]|uniref:Lipoprotein n=1 Tax=Aurantiacibacter xanthus TaxID=1784712 RepID=A0A3A1P4V9_9SPHN|nr:hypothetical protein [Aurantiacibacter xanthus]RIV88146.1 hypothetical protein D2V17_08135 [Aurantiacibacter xanthus]
MTNLSRSLIIGTSVLALAACGPEQIASPGTGSVNIDYTDNSVTNPTPTPSSSPVVAAGDCPTLTADGSVALTNDGTVSGPTGSYRVCTLPGLITKSVTLPKLSGVLYRMNGRVNVGCDGGPVAPTNYTSTTVGCSTPLNADTNVTLTIEPGVILYGEKGASWLAVNRGNKIHAVGTPSKPIIFTSFENVAGVNNENTGGSQWGGVVLLGRATITDCELGTVGGTGAGACQRSTEGSTDPAQFGGNDDTYNAGSMEYVQLRYSGFALSTNKELQALTPSGVGTGTTLSHIQSHRSSDDGAEFFGGKVNMSYYIATGADDDSLDVDTGARLNVQYALLLPVPGQGDALMEIDSNGNEGNTPRTNLQVVNFLAYQPQTSSNNEGNDKAAVLFRGNADVTLYNGAIIAPQNECIRMTANTTAANRATLTARSVALQCSGTGDAKYIGDGSGDAFTAAQVRGFITGDASNKEDFTNTLTGTFFNGSNEDGVAVTSATGLSSFFVELSPNHIGAAWTGNADWYKGWTCNSSIANFGASSTACTSLPTT